MVNLGTDNGAGGNGRSSEGTGDSGISDNASAVQTVEPEMVPELMAEVVMWEMEMLRIWAKVTVQIQKTAQVI